MPSKRRKIKKVVSTLLSLLFVLTALALVSCGGNNGGVSLAVRLAYDVLS